MGLVSVALVAQLEHVVGDGRHGPVVGADDALVVVGEGLSAQLHKQAYRQCIFGPGFKHMEAAVASLAPDAGVLGGNLYLQSFSLEIKVQTGSAYDKVGVVLDVRVLVAGGADAAVPDFSLGEHLKV